MKKTINLLAVAILATMLTSCSLVSRISHKEKTQQDTIAHVERVDRSKIVTIEKAKKDTILPADTITKGFALPPVGRPVVIENDLTKTVIENDGNGFRATTISKPRHVDIETERTTIEDRNVKEESDLESHVKKSEEFKQVEKKPSLGMQIGSFFAQLWYLWLIILALIIWRFRTRKLPV